MSRADWDQVGPDGDATGEIYDAGARRFGGRRVTCNFCERAMPDDLGYGDWPAIWEAAWRLGVLADLWRPDLTPEWPACPECTVMALAELAAWGWVAIIPTRPARTGAER